MKKLAALLSVTALSLSACQSGSHADLRADLAVPGKAVTVLPSSPQIPVGRLSKLSLAKETAVQVYVVKPHDTLIKIADKFDLKWKNLYCYNKRKIGKNPGIIYPDTVLIIGSSHCKIPYPVNSNTGTTNSYTTIPHINFSSGISAFEQCVIQRESGGDPEAVNPSSGAGGLFGFLPETWASLGFPGLPENAPVWMQYEAFSKLYSMEGTAPWAPYDGC